MRDDVGDVWIKQEMSVSVDAPGATGSVTPASTGNDSNGGGHGKNASVELDERVGRLGGMDGVTYNAVARGACEMVEKGGTTTHVEVDEEKIIGF